MFGSEFEEAFEGFLDKVKNTDEFVNYKATFNVIKDNSTLKLMIQIPDKRQGFFRIKVQTIRDHNAVLHLIKRNITVPFMKTKKLSAFVL